MAKFIKVAAADLAGGFPATDVAATLFEGSGEFDVTSANDVAVSVAGMSNFKSSTYTTPVYVWAETPVDVSGADLSYAAGIPLAADTIWMFSFVATSKGVLAQFGPGTSGEELTKIFVRESGGTYKIAVQVGYTDGTKSSILSGTDFALGDRINATVELSTSGQARIVTSINGAAPVVAVSAGLVDDQKTVTMTGMPLKIFANENGFDPFTGTVYGLAMWQVTPLPDMTTQAGFDEFFLGDGTTADPVAINTFLGVGALYQFVGDTEDYDAGLHIGSLDDFAAQGFTDTTGGSSNTGGGGTSTADTYVQIDPIARPASPGVQDPVIAFNLSGYADASPGYPFVDLMLVSEIRTTGSGVPTLYYNDIFAAGVLDPASDWPTGFIAGYDKYRFRWELGSIDHQAPYILGNYRLHVAGTGTLNFSGVDNLTGPDGNGYYHFTISSMSNVFIDITSTDAGDPIKLTGMVRDDHWAQYDAGNIHHPEHLAIVRDARELRFMNWLQTNSGQEQSWAKRGKVGGPYNGRTPFEYCVDLCNRVGADCYWNFHHLTSDADRTLEAEYIRDNLDAGLAVIGATTNECFNGIFPVHQYCRDQSIALWGQDKRSHYAVKLQVHGARVWKAVFAAQPGRELRLPLETQARSTGWTSEQMNPTVWQANEPDDYEDPATVFTELAITSYFGGGDWKAGSNLDDMIAVIKDPDQDANVYRKALLLDANYPKSLIANYNIWTAQKAIADNLGWGLICYEGGQHDHTRGQINHLSASDKALVRDFMVQFARSEEMADLYNTCFAAWEIIGTGPFMHFATLGRPGEAGSWFVQEGYGRPTRRGNAMILYNKFSPASGGNWWGSPVDGRYQRAF